VAKAATELLTEPRALLVHLRLGIREVRVAPMACKTIVVVAEAVVAHL
jgi:hypothetical protein